MLLSEELKRETSKIMRMIEPSNLDIAQRTRANLVDDVSIPKLAGRQGTFKDSILDRIIQIHDSIIAGQTISESDAGFLVLVCFNAANEIQKLQLNCDRLAAEFFKKTLNKISLAGR